MAPLSRATQRTSPSAVNTKMKSPATQGVSRPAMSRSQMRRPLRSSIATMRPPWPIANTMPRSITGLPSVSLNVAMAPIRTPWTARMSAQTVRPFSTRSAVNSPDEKGATTMPPSTCRGRATEKARALRDRCMAPLHGAGTGIQHPQPIVVAYGEDAAAGDHGRSAHGHADRLPPLQGAGLRIQREQMAESCRREQPAPRHREAAAECAFVIVPPAACRRPRASHRCRRRRTRSGSSCPW